jgi:tetratricopeptide (TPR) repeat protein
MRELITGMAPGIPDEAVEAIVQRAAGIPLYAVEFVRMLVSGGDLRRDGGTFTLVGSLADLAIPDSLAAVIGARLDRLDPGDRELVQDASVLGQSFTLQGLAAVRGGDPAGLTEPLRILARHELFELDEDPRSAERGQYRFVQGLIREVAYGRLSLSDRHARHLRVAEYFAGLGEAELAGIVASHFLSAHGTAPAGTVNLLERGRSALLDAARRAATLQAHAQALALYRQALELTTATSDRAAILIDAADAALWAGEVEESLALGHAGVAAMGEIGDPAGALRAHAAIGNALNSFYRADEAAAHLRPVFDTIDAFDTEPRVRLGLEMVRAHMLNRETEEAVAVAERVLPQAERLASPEQVIDGVISKATALANMHRFLEAEATLAGAAALADKLGLQKQAMRALNNLATILTAVDPMAGVRTTEELYDRALKFAGTAWVNRVRGDRAEHLIRLGRFAEATDLLDSADSAHLTHLLAGGHRATRLMIEGLREATPTVGAKLRTEVDSWGIPGDPQVKEWVESVRAFSYKMDGDWDRMFDVAIEVPVPGAVVDALIAGIRTRSADRIRRSMAATEDVMPSSGRLGSAMKRFGEGALMVLEGDRNDGIGEMSGALDQLGNVIPPLDFTEAQTAFAFVVGLDHPAAAAVAAAAQDWIRNVGAYGLERIWADGLPDPIAANRQVG